MIGNIKNGLAALVLTACFFSANAGGAGRLEFGVQYQGWDDSYSAVPIGGHEFWYPLTLSFQAAPEWGFYAQTKLGNGNYTPTLLDFTGESHLTALTDTVVGTAIGFKLFGLPSFFDVDVNIPTGDKNWEVLQAFATPPVEFIESRYHGRGFGLNALWGLSVPEGTTSLSGVVAYLYSGAFNPDYGLGVPVTLQLGDSLYTAVVRTETFPGNQTSVIRLSGLFSFPTYKAGVEFYQMGPDISLSYAFNDPKGFSYEVGTQILLSAQQAGGGGLVPEPYNSFGRRFYAAPSMAFGDFTLSGRVKYVTANDYPVGDPSRKEEGWMFGLMPSLIVPTGEGMSLKFTVSYDYIVINTFLGILPGEMDYHRLTVGSYYDIKL